MLGLSTINDDLPLKDGRTAFAFWTFSRLWNVLTRRSESGRETHRRLCVACCHAAPIWLSCSHSAESLCEGKSYYSNRRGILAAVEITTDPKLFSKIVR